MRNIIGIGNVYVVERRWNLEMKTIKVKDEIDLNIFFQKDGFKSSHSIYQHHIYKMDLDDNHISLVAYFYFIRNDKKLFHYNEETQEYDNPIDWNKNITFKTEATLSTDGYQMAIHPNYLNFVDLEINGVPSDLDALETDPPTISNMINNNTKIKFKIKENYSKKQIVDNCYLSNVTLDERGHRVTYFNFLNACGYFLSSVTNYEDVCCYNTKITIKSNTEICPNTKKEFEPFILYSQSKTSFKKNGSTTYYPCVSFNNAIADCNYLIEQNLPGFSL